VTGNDAPGIPRATEATEIAEAGAAEAAGTPFAAPDAPAPTGIGPVDAALAALAEVPGLPVDRHAEVYERAHAALRDTLARLDA
jgi:hypothetical protein